MSKSKQWWSLIYTHLLHIEQWLVKSGQVTLQNSQKFYDSNLNGPYPGLEKWQIAIHIRE